MRRVRIRAVAAGAAIALAASLVAACGSDGSAGDAGGGSSTSGASGSAASGMSGSSGSASGASGSAASSSSAAGGMSGSASGASGSAASSSSAASGMSSSTSGASGSGSSSGPVDLSKDTKKDITIPIAAGWAEDVAVTNLWKYVLEQQGYTVETPTLDIGPIFIGVSKGDYDVFFDTWLPGTHKEYWAKYGDKIDDIGVWYKNAPLTIAVPDYMDIDSIADLPSVADDLDKTITGIDAGAGETGVVQNDMMPAYGLDKAGWNLKTSSSQAMLIALKKAIDAHDPIVVTLWKPHWAYSVYPIKDLKDPKGGMGKPDSIHVVGSTDIANTNPGLVAALKNFTMDDQSLNSLEAATVQDPDATTEEIQAGVKEWAEKNPDFIKGMLGG